MWVGTKKLSTPPSLPTDFACRLYYVPNSPEWLELWNGLISGWMQDYRWQQTPGGLTVEDTIQAVNTIWETRKAVCLDYKIKATGQDAVEDYLYPSLLAGANITLQLINPGADEKVEISATAPAVDDKTVKVSASDTTPNFLLSKLQAGAFITLALVGAGGNEKVEIGIDAPAPVDEKVKVSANDTTPGYLLTKLAAGTGIAINELNNGGDEDAQIVNTKPETYLAKVSASDTTPDYLFSKLVAGTGVAINKLNPAGNEDVQVVNTLPETYNVRVSANDTTPGTLLPKLVAGSNITLTEQNNGGNESILIAAAAPGAVTAKAAQLYYQQAQGVSGGTTTAGAWETIPISHEIDPDALITINGSQQIYIAGTYTLDYSQTIYAGNTTTFFWLRLYNVTQASEVFMSHSYRAAANAMVTVNLKCRFVSNGTDNFAIQSWVTDGLANNGLGTAANYPGRPERYGSGVVIKVA